MSTKNSIAAVVVTYNRKALLRQCIECLLAQTDVGCDILVVDNNSTDGTSELISGWDAPRVFYRNTGENIGGAGGFNLGMRWAVEAGYRYVWVMDDDTQPQADALSALMRADRVLNGEYGFLSSLTLWTDGRCCRMNRQKLHKACCDHLEQLREGMVAIQQATFVSGFFPAKVIGRVGLPIKDFFIWGDDIEYTRRIAVREGLPCYLVGGSVVVHATANNHGSNLALDEPPRIDRYRYAFRNENYLYRQEGLRGFAYYTAKCGITLVRVLRHAKGKRMRRCGVVIRQYFAGLWFNPHVEFISSQGGFTA